MPDTPHARSLIETVARALWESDKLDWVSPDYSQHEAYIKRQAGVAILAVLDAIAGPSEDFTFRCFAAGDPSIEAMREALVVKRDYEWWALRFREDIRAMIAELRKEIENG